MTALLAVEELTVRFGGVTALEDVSFTVERGERVALNGPNGAGKTTVLDCVSGVVRAAAGRVRWQGRDLVGVRPAARTALGLSRTVQSSGLVDSLDVASNLLLGRHHRMRAGLLAAAVRWPAARAEEASHRARCEEVAVDLGLAAQLTVAAGALTAGQRKRLELGRALAADGALLLLDEPFAGAGPDDVDVMVAAIRRATGVGGAAAVVVDHDTDTVLALCDRLVALDGGRVGVGGR